MDAVTDIVQTPGPAGEHESAIVYDARHSAVAECRGDTARGSAPCGHSAASPGEEFAGSTSPFAAGEIVWIPSVSAGFTTAVVLHVDATHQRLLARLHPAATDELRAVQGALPVANAQRSTTAVDLQQATHQQQKGQVVDREHLQQPGEEQVLVPHKLDGEVGLATAADADGIDGVHERAIPPVEKQQEEPAFPDARSCSEIFVPIGETWTYKPLPPPPAAVPEDAVALDCLSAASVLQLLQHRFLRNQIYTFAAHVLLAVNPCQTLPGLYGYDVVEIYRHWRGRQSAAAAARLLAPHVAQYLGFSSTSSSVPEGCGNTLPAQPLVGNSSAAVALCGNRIVNGNNCSTTCASNTRGGNRQHGSKVHSGGTGLRGDNLDNSDVMSSNFTSNNFSSNTLNGSSFPPAHPFAIAQDAHRRLRGEGQKQTIIVSGESGAGKTETSKILMLYLTEVGSLLSSSSCNQFSTRDWREAAHRIRDNSGEQLCSAAEDGEEEQQQPLPTYDRSDEKTQSRQAQRRAAAAALLHAVTAKQTTCSTPSASGSSRFPLTPRAACRSTAEAAGAAVAPSFSCGALPVSSAVSPFASDTACETANTQSSTAATQGREPATAELQQRILSCNPVLEAFCNAKTRRNSNSSRVGRLTLLHFDRGGLLHGASIKTYLLESTRVCSHPLWERNFHVFYQLLRGCSKEDLERRRLQRCCEAYLLLTPTSAALAAHQRSDHRLPARRLIVSAASPTAASTSSFRGSEAATIEPPPPSQEELSRDTENYALLIEALSKTGFSAGEIVELFDALAGLLHLSNVSFKEIPSLKAGATHALVIRHGPRSVAAPAGGESSNSGAAAGTPAAAAMSQDIVPAVQCAAELLRLPLEQLEEVLLWETLTTRHETLRKQRRAEQAAAARDALIKCTYTRIVQYVLTKLNESVLARQQSRATSDFPQQQHHPDQEQQPLLYQPSDSVNNSNESSTGDTDAGRVRHDVMLHDLSEKASALDTTSKRARGFLTRRGDTEEESAAALWGAGLSTGNRSSTYQPTPALDISSSGLPREHAEHLWRSDNYSPTPSMLPPGVSDASLVDAHRLLLDIYGFESLEGGSNGFEQLCINYANEKQQQIFLQRAISEELRLYRCEGLLGVLSSLQPALLLSSDNSSNSDGFTSAALFPLSIRPSPTSPSGTFFVHSYTGRSTTSSSSADRTSGNSFPGRTRNISVLNKSPAWLLQGQHLSCEKRTEELLFYLSEGLFKRLDDNSRLRARGQQQRLDVHFWRDFFSFCRQREIQLANLVSDRGTGGTITGASTGRCSKSNTSCHVTTAEEPQEQQQPPVLFRLLRSAASCVSAPSAPAAAHSAKLENGRSPKGAGASTARNVEAALVQQQCEKTGMQQLVAAKDVRPLHADAAAAASTLQQGIFVVKHFAGHVEYRVDGWLARNNDKADAEIESLMNLSGLRALQAADSTVLAGAGVCCDSSGTASSAGGGLVKCSQARNRSPLVSATAGTITTSSSSSSSNRHFVSVSQQFIADLRQLMGELQSNDVHLHFIRCFVSNRAMRPSLLDRALLLRQLQQSGTVALIHVLHQGFPHRLPLSPLAAVFKSKLKECIAAAAARLQREQLNDDDRAARDIRAEQLQRLQALRVDNVPDGRLVAVAVEMLPDCPRGTVSCGISSLFFKAGAYLPATALLKSPEALFSHLPMLLRLQHESTRRRWRFAVAASGHVRRRLWWLLRRVRLLRIIKERFILCAIRVLLLRRYILLPLLLRVQKRAAAAAALKLLHRLLVARGFHAWLLAHRRAAAAEGAALSLAARVAAASAGKDEQPETCDVSSPQQQRQLHTSGRPVLIWRHESSSSKCNIASAGQRPLAGGSAAACTEENHQLVQSPVEQQQQQPGQLQKAAPRSGGRRNVEEAKAAAVLSKKRAYNSSFQHASRNAAASCWWKAALFSIHATCGCCRMRKYLEAAVTDTAEIPLVREICEYFLLYTGNKLYALQLLVTQQLQAPRETDIPGRGAATAKVTKQHHIRIHCYALLLITRPLMGDGYTTQQRSCFGDDTKGEKTASKTPRLHAEQQIKQQRRQQELSQQQGQPAFQQSLPSRSHQQHTDKRPVVPTLQQQQQEHRSTSSERLPRLTANDAGETIGNTNYVESPALVCIAQHAHHPQLFVGCDRQARIFLLPLDLPFSSTIPAAGEVSNERNPSLAVGDAPCTTEVKSSAIAVAAATASGAAENGCLHQQRNSETQQQQHTSWRRGREAQQPYVSLQQQSLPGEYSTSQGNSTTENEEERRISGSHERGVQESTRPEVQHRTARNKEKRYALEGCCSEQHWQQCDPLQTLLPCSAGLNMAGYSPQADVSLSVNAASAANSSPAIRGAKKTSIIVGRTSSTAAVADSAKPLSSHACPETAYLPCGSSGCSPLPPITAAVDSKGTQNVPQQTCHSQEHRSARYELARTRVPGNEIDGNTLNIRGNDGTSDGLQPASSGSRMQNNSFNRIESSSSVSSIGQTSCSNSVVSGSSTSQMLSAHDGIHAEARHLPRANSSLLHVEVADPNTRISSTAKKVTLKSLGGGQPSTWLPALVCPSPDLSVCRTQHASAPAATAAVSASSLFAAAGNPYLDLFRRAPPLPSPPDGSALPLSIPVLPPQSQQHEQQKQICLRVTPWLEAQGRCGSSSTLYLLRSCCFPRSLGPAAWVPPTLLERAEQRHEQAVLQHHRQQEELETEEHMPQRTVSVQRHQQEQQQRDRERRQQQQHLQQRHVTVRPIRIRFASSYTTQYILVLAYVSAASSSNSRTEKGVGGYRSSSLTATEQQKQKPNGIAVVAGLWAVILVDLLRQQAVDWKEIYAAQPDVIESARLYRPQLPFLFPLAASAESYVRSSSAIGIKISSSRNAGSCDHNTPGNDRASSSNSDEPHITSTRRHRKHRSTSSASNASMISPSQIVSTGLLESFGEGKWIVAGPGVLGLLQVRGLPSAHLSASPYYSNNKEREKASNRPQNETKSKATGAEEVGYQSVTTKRNVEESKPKIEILWNQARVQQFFSRRRRSVVGGAAATRACFDVASTWITGCIYTTTPLTSLQDIGPTHPLLTHGALAPDSKVAHLLQQHFHHLLMLTTAAGDLLLLRWLPQKCRLRLLRRLPSSEEKSQAMPGAFWRRLIRMQYADASDEEEDAAAEQLLLGARSCCGGSCAAASSRSSFFRVGATPILRLSWAHPHARKQQERQGNDGQGETRLQTKISEGRRQREGARDEKSLATKRWLDDVGALVAYSETRAHDGNSATSGTAAASTATAGGDLRDITMEDNDRALRAGTASGSIKRRAVQILRLEKPPLIRKRRQSTLQTMEGGGEIEGCSTSADSTTSGGGASPRSNIDGGSEGGNPQPHHHMRSSCGGGSFGSCSDGDSRMNGSESRKVEEENTSAHEPSSSPSPPKAANNNVCLTDGSRHNTLARSSSELQQVDPVPQQPDPREQQQQPCLGVHRPHQEQPQHQAFRHKREDSAIQKTRREHPCSAAAQSYSFHTEHITNARALDCNSFEYADVHVKYSEALLFWQRW